ncbi:ESF1 homolog [Rhodamnia argentea]|uniref:ESF1 homolog n=1 Tax=Rhodamnia argentea TaxID=178133 RepID=A0A8B8NPJ5_9MYRT|nr:ESF1 homolog [Rhodamnia argentea]
MGSKRKDKHNKRKTEPSNLESKVDDHESAGGCSVGGAKIITDSRFASVHSDPRFQRVPKHKAKVAIDSRFNRMFSDKSFSSSAAPLDKRGRPKKQSSRNSLRHYYRIEEDGGREEEADEEEEEEEVEEQRESVAKRAELSEESADELESGSEVELEGGGESESTTDTDEGGDEDVYEEEGVEVQEENIPTIDKETRRLAVLNMDWRHVKAVDLFVLLSSFLPKGGQILSVAVYPSEFGIQRMKDEEIHGPVGLFDDDDNRNEDEDDGEINDEKLRAYEKSRLRYYYGVVECDSSATADYLYNACDGLEVERSSNMLDLRFIPDSMEFKHAPRDVATEAPVNYEAVDFQTRALQQSKIHLTWDEDEPDRVKTLKRKFNADQLADLELREFLASDESEYDYDREEGVLDDQPDKKGRKRDMYRALLEGGNGSDGDGEDENRDMEITFNTGLEDLSKRILEKKDKKSETVWDAQLRKQREKKNARKNKAKDSSDDESSDTVEDRVEQEDDFFVEEPSVKRSKKGTRRKNSKAENEHQDVDGEGEASRAELELLLADENGADTGPKGYKIKAKKTKGKKGDQMPDDDKIPTVDYSDSRFSALFTSPLFALDPTDPQFKRSAAYARQVAQRQHKGDRPESVENDAKKIAAKIDLPPNDLESGKGGLPKSDVLAARKEKHELSSLVRSLKMKSKRVPLPSNSKSSKKVDKVRSRRHERKGEH